MSRKPILVYDLNDPEMDRACIATKNAITRDACRHGYTWRCPHVVERYVFDTSSPAAAELIAQALAAAEVPD